MNPLRTFRFGLLVALAMSAGLSPASSETAVMARFQGCEADDVRALTAEGDKTWSGKTHVLGPWEISNTARIDCDETECNARMTTKVSHEGAPLPEPKQVQPSLSFPDAGGRSAVRLIVEGSGATSLRQNIGSAAFEDEGRLRRILMDYGSLARLVTIRIRTQIDCDTVQNACDIVATPLAFVPYTEQMECGSLASSLAGGDR